jgi:hypothetical protein
MIFGLFKYQPLRIAAYNYDYPLWGHIFGKLSVHLFEKNAVNKLNSSEFNGFQMRIFQQLIPISSTFSFIHNSNFIQRLVLVAFLNALHPHLCHLHLGRNGRHHFRGTQLFSFLICRPPKIGQFLSIFGVYPLKPSNSLYTHFIAKRVIQLAHIFLFNFNIYSIYLRNTKSYSVPMWICCRRRPFRPIPTCRLPSTIIIIFPKMPTN